MFILPEYYGAPYPQHNPDIGPINFIDLPTIYDSYEVVKERLVAKLSYTVNEDFPLVGYSSNLLMAAWRKDG